jgi:hypothetical protein
MIRRDADQSRQNRTRVRDRPSIEPPRRQEIAKPSPDFLGVLVSWRFTFWRGHKPLMSQIPDAIALKRRAPHAIRTHKAR